MSGFVYFIEAGRGGPIKIGFATDVASRMKSLQTASHKTLLLLLAVPGNQKDEHALHRRFKSERTSGEWFRGKGPVRDFALGLIGMPEVDRVVAIRHTPEPARAWRGKVKRPARRVYTAEQWRSMFFVDGGGIYRSAEAEEVLADRERLYGAIGGKP